MEGGATAAEHHAATTIFCWVRRLSLRRWFRQQQRRKRLQALCRGASMYAMSVWGDRRPPPTPTDKPSDPKVLRHPLRDRGLPLPRRRRARRTKRPRRRPGRRHRPRAPDSGGGPQCMPLCFWATQTAVATMDPCDGINRLALKPYLPPHIAATVIQRAYRVHCIDERGVRMQLSCAKHDQGDNVTGLSALAALAKQNAFAIQVLCREMAGFSDFRMDCISSSWPSCMDNG